MAAERLSYPVPARLRVLVVAGFVFIFVSACLAALPCHALQLWRQTNRIMTLLTLSAYATRNAWPLQCLHTKNVKSNVMHTTCAVTVTVTFAATIKGEASPCSGQPVARPCRVQAAAWR